MTSVPTGPVAGSSLSMVGVVGVGVTSKLTPALACPPEVVTTTGPSVAPAGTDVLILPSSQSELAMEAAVPLKVTLPFELPKLDPLIWTLVPTRPELGFNSLMVGVDV